MNYLYNHVTREANQTVMCCECAKDEGKREIDIIRESNGECYYCGTTPQKEAEFKARLDYQRH